jgi:hypothetical protein
LENREVEWCSGEKWAPTVDVSAFASLVFEIAVGGLPHGPWVQQAARLFLPLAERLFRE